MVEGTGLENRHTGNRIEGSNPSPSAIKKCLHFYYKVGEQRKLLCVAWGFERRSHVHTQCVQASPGRKFLTSGAQRNEFRNLTPNPSPSAIKKCLHFYYKVGEQRKLLCVAWGFERRSHVHTQCVQASPGRKFLTSGAQRNEFRNLTPNPSPSAGLLAHPLPSVPRTS